eukprot:839749-Prymnesium_polylepis.1
MRGRLSADAAPRPIRMGSTLAPGRSPVVTFPSRGRAPATTADTTGHAGWPGAPSGQAGTYPL